MIDCGTCAVRTQVDGLDAANTEAWTKYRHLTGHRVVWDASAGSWWMGHVFRDVDPDDLDDLMRRISVLYDVFAPAKTPPS